MKRRHLTHSGIDIASLMTRSDVWRELRQEALEAVVFGILSWSMAVDGPRMPDGNILSEPMIATVISVLLAGFCLNRLAVILELVYRLRMIQNPFGRN